MTIGGSTLAILIAAVLFCSSVGLPEARELRAFAPESAGEASWCKKEAQPILPVNQLRPLFAAYDASEGMGHINTQVARNANCFYNNDHLHWLVHETRLASYVKFHYSLDERRAMILNLGYFGGHQSGIESGSQTLFHKSASQLSHAQAALLLGLLRQPGTLSPIKHPDRALARRNFVLDRMHMAGALDDAGVIAAKAEPLLPSR